MYPAGRLLAARDPVSHTHRLTSSQLSGEESGGGVRVDGLYLAGPCGCAKAGGGLNCLSLTCPLLQLRGCPAASGGCHWANRTSRGAAPRRRRQEWVAARPRGRLRVWSHSRRARRGQRPQPLSGSRFSLHAGGSTLNAAAQESAQRHLKWKQDSELTLEGSCLKSLKPYYTLFT